MPRWFLCILSYSFMVYLQFEKTIGCAAFSQEQFLTLFYQIQIQINVFNNISLAFTFVCVCVFDQVLLGDLVCSSLCGKQSLVQSLNDSIFTWKCSFHHSLSSINTTSNLHESACIMVLFLLLHSLNPTIMVDSRPH